MEKVYLAIVCSGEYEDYFERIHFITHNKEETYKWVAHFNKIVEDNESRISTFYDDENYDKKPCFGYDYILYFPFKAKVKEMQLKTF